MGDYMNKRWKEYADLTNQERIDNLAQFYGEIDDLHTCFDGTLYDAFKDGKIRSFKAYDNIRQKSYTLFLVFNKLDKTFHTIKGWEKEQKHGKTKSKFFRFFVKLEKFVAFVYNELEHGRLKECSKETKDEILYPLDKLYDFVLKYRLKFKRDGYNNFN